ncbi:MAG: tetraacyldisaccharide 4'-kinase [Gemmatimonadota bacterium]
MRGKPGGREPPSQPGGQARWQTQWQARWWAGELPWVADAVLRVPELLFRMGVALRNRRYAHRPPSESLPVPVISVGNLSVGGTGKTPFSAWVVQELLEEGHRPALLTRGYGTDEIQLHRGWNPKVPVVAHPRRRRALQEAVEGGCTVAVLDDGFQHRALPRTLDLVLVAAEGGFPPRLLPRGPYREGLDALGRAHAVIFTRRTASASAVDRLAGMVAREHPRLPQFRVRFAPGKWHDLLGQPAAAPSAEARGVALTSIARPDLFQSWVVERWGTGRVSSLTFADHHMYTTGDVEGIVRRTGPDGWVITTEKDAVKLRAFRDQLPRVRVLTLTLEFEEGGQRLRQMIQGVGGRPGTETGEAGRAGTGKGGE